MTRATRIVELLVAWMAAAGLSPEEVAEAADLPQGLIVDILDGEVSPTPGQISRIGQSTGRTDAEIGAVVLELLLPELEAA